MSYYCPTISELQEHMREYFQKQRNSQKRILQDAEGKNFVANTNIPKRIDNCSAQTIQASPQPTINNYNYYPANNSNKVNTISATKAGFITAISGGICYWLYSKSIAFADIINRILGRATELQLEPQLLFTGIIGIGIIIMLYGFIQRR
ncbi:MAG: hypothetical protein AYK22_07585 [Thermoplasmatales archaeon SG8-52-3]|nr:MAG: hypothetical protein AYK22_07585 [Thermoplasmatales archaeon SG8-52-3]